MKKRILSLCMVLVLCLGLLPATALAAAPENQVIYVGGVEISSTGYWTTDAKEMSPHTQAKAHRRTTISIMTQVTIP